MLHLISQLKEIEVESSFKWTINNFSGVNLSKTYIIKSEKIEFKEANGSWYVQLEPSIHDFAKVYTTATIFLLLESCDENSTFNFDITLNDGTVFKLDPYIMCENPTLVIKQQFPTRIIIDCEDSIEFVARVTYKTLKCHSETSVSKEISDVEKEDEEEEEKFEKESDVESEKEKESEEEEPEAAEPDDDYDYLTDAVEKESTTEFDRNNSNCGKCEDGCGILCGEFISDDSSSGGSSYLLSPIGTKREIPIEDMNDKELVDAISKIYMTNMKQISDLTSGLLVLSAQNNNKNLLAECASSLAEQINLKNFTKIWDIAVKLDIEDLKKEVIDFIIENRVKVTYNESMTPDLMLNVVRASN